MVLAVFAIVGVARDPAPMDQMQRLIANPVLAFGFQTDHLFPVMGCDTDDRFTGFFSSPDAFQGQEIGGCFPVPNRLSPFFVPSYRYPDQAYVRISPHTTRHGVIPQHPSAAAGQV